MSQSGRFTPSVVPGTYVETLTGNTGGAVHATAGGNINVVGDGVVTTTIGNPGTNTIEITLTGAIADEYVTDIGTATPALGVLNITGGSTGLLFEGSGNTVSLDGILGVLNGGTGSSGFTPYTIILAGTTDVGNFENVASTGSSGQILVSNGSAAIPSWENVPASSISLTGDSGGAITGDAFTITGGVTGLTFSGDPATHTLTLTGGALEVDVGGTGNNAFTAYAPIVGGTTTTGILQSASTGMSNSGYVFTSTGASSIPQWEVLPASSISITGDTGGALTGSAFTFHGGTTGLSFAGSGTTETLGGVLGVANGGTDATTITGLVLGNGTSAMTGITPGDYGVLISSATGVPSWLANGTTGKVLTATTSGTPSWESAGSGSITIDGDTGSATGTTITFNANTNSGASVRFTASGSTVDLNVTDANNNTCIGLDCGSDNGSYNTIIGAFAGGSATNAQENTGVGYQVLADITANGDSNVAIGYESLRQITTGSGNVCVGGGSGTNYTSSESNNIILGNDITVTVGESNVLRIGGGTGTGSGNLNAAYICGISGVNVGSVATVVTEASNQLGTAVLTAGTGISIVPTANTITISSSSSGFSWHDVTGGSATLAAENGYIADSASLTTFTMPTNNSLGDTIKIVGKGSGGWKIVYSALQNIIFGNVTSTTTTGNISSNNANDCLELVCTTASIAAPIFTVVSSVGNISVN